MRISNIAWERGADYIIFTYGFCSSGENGKSLYNVKVLIIHLIFVYSICKYVCI